MSRTSANRLIQLNTNRRNLVDNLDNNSFNNTPITNNTSRLSTVLTPFSLISNSFTQDIKDLADEITWLEICNIIIAIALALIAVSLAVLFFDPGEFDVLVMMARIRIDDDTFMEIYDIENLIRIINELYTNFISE
jgi:hypothetical protein